MKKYISILILCCVILGISRFNVYANSGIDYSQYKYYYIDDKGNAIYEFNDNISNSEESSFVNSAEDAAHLPSKGYNLLRASAAPDIINYLSTLGTEKPINTRLRAFARSEVTTPGVVIDSMLINLRAYGPEGSNYGQSFNENPSGTKVGILSAYVYVFESPFPLEIGRAYSDHFYDNQGYDSVHTYLEWHQ